MGHAANPVAQVAFEHGDDGFHLVALTIGFRVEALFHQPPVLPGRELAGRAGPAALGRDDRTHSVILAQPAVVGFRVVAGVQHHPVQYRMPREPAQQPLQRAHVRPGSDSRHGREDDVVGRVGDDVQFGKTPIGHVFWGFSALSGPPDIVAAGPGGLEAGGVSRGRPHPSAAAHDSLHGSLQQPIDAGLGEQPAGGLLQGGPVRHGLQFDAPAQIGTVPEQFPEAAVVGAQMSLEHQTGEELVLGEFLRAVAMRMGRQGVLGSFPGFPQHLSRRLAGGHEPL